MIRRTLIWLLMAMVTLGILTAPSEAQQPYRQRDSMASNSPRASSASRGSLDRFQPYTSSSRNARTATSYRSDPKPVRPEVTRTNYYSQRRDYFPGLRTGQGPNQNRSQHGHCVPSRSALLLR
ncbi:hypothetical protein SAMN05444166_1464 [Singulisphaera sp. GP187]|uniref:hypothetical protein n=1 Tax=Singulisphaera sp. GP187 TaxID=1882752 RepID=UPI00092A6305|nr:hypothetical protein [Singulisphaera sp. GP187]SIN89022.1 hypothetical protein SAMN05444166_1464 [Singulisphaera sp. GP187]